MTTAFSEQLERGRAHRYTFQFDGFDSETYRIIRGEPGYSAEKTSRPRPPGRNRLHVILVPAIERGVNEHEIGKIVRLRLRSPGVKGINFQPAFHAGRHGATIPCSA